MNKLVLRWTFGETKAYKLSSQAWDMLEYSIKFCILLFKAEFNHINFFICYNNLSRKAKKIVKDIALNNSIEAIDVSEMLPFELRNSNVKNSWWKYAPTRMDRQAYEIIIDNDVVMWEIPDTLRMALEKNAMVALEDGVGGYYGEFKKEVEDLHDKFALNAGLMGFPPGVEINLSAAIEKHLKDYFFSEQGYTALNYAKYNGLKLLIPLSEIQQLNINRIGPEQLISKHKGGHFCGCSFNIENNWRKIYSKHVKRKYQEMISN